MTEKTFMILGASSGQIPAIRMAKKLGYQVLVTDMNPDAVGKEEADFFECVNTIDLEASLDVAKRYNVCGAMTISSDIAVPTVCYINEQLHLANQGIGISHNVTDKALMRELFAQYGVQSPAHFTYENDADIFELAQKLPKDLKETPFIVKPTDSSGSRGVTKITETSELQPAINHALAFSRNHKVVVEQFVDGIEIGAQTFSVNGEMIKCFIHNDTTSKNMIPIGHSFPYVGSANLHAKITAECDKALRALGIENGPSNIDIILTDEGVPYVIEIGARIGATKLPEIVTYHTGWDLIAATIQQSASAAFKLEETGNQAVAVEMLYFEEDGVVENLESIDSIITEFAPLEYEVLLRKGTVVKRLKSGVDVYGYVICKGIDATEAEENCRQLIEAIKSKVTFKVG